MRFPILALISAVGLATVAVSARAAPLAPAAEPHSSSNIIRVYGGCGWGFHPVPGHWSEWRGEWLPPHCAPNRYGYYRRIYPHYGYGVGYPYAGYPYGYEYNYQIGY